MSTAVLLGGKMSAECPSRMASDEIHSFSTVHKCDRRTDRQTDRLCQSNVYFGRQNCFHLTHNLTFAK